MVGRRSFVALAFLVGACGSGTAVANDAVTPPISTVVATADPIPTTPTMETTVLPSPTTEDPEAMLPNPPASPTPDPTATPQPPTPVPAAPIPDCLRLTEFATEADNSSWFVVNDNVMGGRSNGGPTFADGMMVFEGDINTNGGGFSSIRAEIVPGAFADYTHLRLRAQHDGRPYKITLEDGLEERDRRVSFQAPLVFDDDEQDPEGWETAQVNFADLTPRIFGRNVESPPVRPDLVNQLGLMLSDSVDGPFRIQVDWVDLCR